MQRCIRRVEVYQSFTRFKLIEGLLIEKTLSQTLGLYVESVWVFCLKDLHHTSFGIEVKIAINQQIKYVHHLMIDYDGESYVATLN